MDKSQLKDSRRALWEQLSVMGKIFRTLRAVRVFTDGHHNFDYQVTMLNPLSWVLVLLSFTATPFIAMCVPETTAEVCREMKQIFFSNVNRDSYPYEI